MDAVENSYQFGNVPFLSKSASEIKDHKLLKVFVSATALSALLLYQSQIPSYYHITARQ